jgi:DNA-binding transcriptional ArsR family regulator
MAADEVIPSPPALKALAHPVRLRLLGLLRTEGASTASRLAERLGLNSGATSYHLRQLAEHGFVVEDAGRGNARERWWRAAHRSTHVPESYSDEESARDAREAFSQAVAVTYAGELQRAVEAQATTPPEWHGATDFSDWSLRLTPDEARELLAEVHAVVERRRRWDPDRPEAPAGAGLYRILITGFPRPWQGTGETP